MITIKISPIRCVLYSLINILHILLFTFLILVLWNVGQEGSNNNQGVILCLSILFFILAVYPVVFLVYFWLSDKNKCIQITKATDDAIYKQRGEKDFVFNIRDVDKITVSYPFIRITVNHYYKIYLNSGRVVIVSCLTSIEQLKKRVNTKSEKVETKLWIDDFIKTT